MLEGKKEERLAGEGEREKSKRGRPAGSKNANKTRIDDLSDATLAAVCLDLDLAPAVGTESSVREQRIRGIHAASGSTAKLPKTNLDGLSVATLKLICADRKLPTSGEDKDGKIFIDRILAGLPGKKSPSQLENRNLDGHAASGSADLKIEGGGGGGQDEAMKGLQMQVEKLQCLLARSKTRVRRFDTRKHTHTHTRMQVEKLQELLAAKSVYDDAIGAIKKRAGMHEKQ